MAELSSIEKLQPCLLDRLTDSAPENKLESRSERVMSINRYREAVLRDLKWLLTTPRPDMESSLEEFPEVATSVLNYGTRNLCGCVSDSLDMDVLERELREALIAFEPRIDPSSVSVKGLYDHWNKALNEMNFEIRGDLWANPMPEELFIKTKLDLETGSYDFTTATNR